VVEQTKLNEAGPGAPGAQGGPPWGVPGPERGPVRRAIVAIALPMAMADLVGLLTLVGVFALMGRMGEQAVYVRSYYMPVASLFLAVFLAFAISNQVAAAISRGRGRAGDVLPTAFSFARLWLVLGVVLIVVTLVGGPAIAGAFGVSGEARGAFVAFVRWMSVAELSQIGLVLAASSLRGFGNAKAGGLIMLIGSAIQFGGVALLGLAGGMGPASVPLSIGVSSVVGALIGYRQLRRNGLWTAGQWRDWRPDAVVHLRRVGVPIAATQIILFGANSALVIVLSQLGPQPVAGYAGASTLQLLILMPGLVLGSATAIVLNQQRGAGKGDWLPGTLRTGLEVTAVLYVVLAVLAWLGSGLLGRLMTDSPGISSEITSYLSIVGLTLVFNGPVLAALAIMEQIGAGLVAVALNFVYFAAIVLAGALVLKAHPNSAAFYQTIAWCNVAGVGLVAAAVAAVRKASVQPVPAGPPQP
jgi:Na+-driven multidrug efflux pump